MRDAFFIANRKNETQGYINTECQLMMKNAGWMVLWCGLASSVLAADETAMPSPALSTNDIMQIDDWHVPSDWFRHEFRSTYFRHAGATNVRDAVFAPFRKRMILHARATMEGLDRDPALQAEIEERVANQRAFMEYQLAMVRIDMVNEAMVNKLGVTVAPGDITDEQVQHFFEENIKTRPGAPSTLDDVPPSIMESIKAQAARTIMEQKLNELIQTREGEMTITVNRDAVERVPMPEMKGTPPAGWNPR